MTKRWGNMLLAAWATAWLTGGTVQAANNNGPGLAGDMNMLENRFFFRVYTRDPLEKRLERLELLVFGATQGGTTEERAARLKKTIRERDNSSSGWTKGKEGSGNAGQSSPAEPSGQTSGKKEKTSSAGQSAKYPILNTLEWRAIKKTFPEETLDQRLERLETKLFGASSPAMAYADRVERLKRTLGVGVAQNLPNETAGPIGPGPKARPRTDMFEGSNIPPDFPEPFGSFNNLPQFGTMPGLSGLFKDMQRQLEQLRRMPSGVWEWDPESGTWLEKNKGNRLKPGPGQAPFDMNKLNPADPEPFHQMPKFLHPDSRQDIPPYGDPNSI